MDSAPTCALVFVKTHETFPDAGPRPETVTDPLTTVTGRSTPSTVQVTPAKIHPAAVWFPVGFSVKVRSAEWVVAVKLRSHLTEPPGIVVPFAGVGLISVPSPARPAEKFHPPA
ncbi:MAG: hypothetical protein IPL36_11490 [Nigerium sp.]|nr:hypothetical protein [Nigerium sp.]